MTGDKGSTAKAVGYQSGILSQNHELSILEFNKETDKDALISKIIGSESVNKDFMISGTALQVLIETIM